MGIKDFFKKFVQAAQEAEQAEAQKDIDDALRNVEEGRALKENERKQKEQAG